MKPLPIFVTAIAALTSTACGHHTPDPEHGSGDPESLIAEAEQTLAKARELDLRAPADRGPRQALRATAAEKLVEACRLGDRRSCWRATSILDAGGSSQLMSEAVTELGQACLDGDEASCRALAGSDVLGMFDQRADALCERDLAAACLAVAASQSGADRIPWYERACALGDGEGCHELWYEAMRSSPDANADVEALAETAALRLSAECDRGFAQRCKLLALFHDGSSARVDAAAESGCRDGLLEDCALLATRANDPTLRELGAREACEIRGEACGTLAELATRPEDVRDALEHGCEIFIESDLCVDLASRYLDGSLPEPVQNRGADLAAWLCEDWTSAAACALLEH